MSGFMPCKLLGAAERESESGHHFVVDEQRAVLLREAAEFGRGTPASESTRPMLPTTGSRMTPAILSPVALERLLQGGDVVVTRAPACRRCSPLGTPGLFGTPSVVALEPAETSRLSTWP